MAGANWRPGSSALRRRSPLRLRAGRRRFGYVVIFLETVGALCIILGLFTRFFAAGCAIEMAVIAFNVQMSAGYSQMELFVLLGIVFFAIALRGGGPYSLDRKIGKEL